MSEKKMKFIHRENPPSFSMGFRVGIVDGGMCIIDFLDNPDKDVLKVSSAIMLTKDGAKDLVKRLNEFVYEE